MRKFKVLTALLLSVLFVLFAVGSGGKDAAADDNSQVQSDSNKVINEIKKSPISCGENYTVAVKNDGTVVATMLPSYADNYGQCDVARWTDIVAVAAGTYHTVGLKSDGTVVAVGTNPENSEYSGRCDVEDWTDIVSVAVGYNHTIGLKSDGTVVAVGSDFYGQCKVTAWTDIVAIAAGPYHSVGLRSDGTVITIDAFTSNFFGPCSSFTINVDGTNLSGKYAGALNYTAMKK